VILKVNFFGFTINPPNAADLIILTGLAPQN
jgi:hypothetical protein